jgi:DNA-binding response OmpR family regulator
MVTPPQTARTTPQPSSIPAGQVQQRTDQVRCIFLSAKFASGSESCRLRTLELKSAKIPGVFLSGFDSMAKILLVEDDCDLCRMISDALEAEKHVVDMVHNGDEGRNRLLYYEYDLVVLDWQLPRASAVEILQEMRSRGGVTPVIMLTGKSALAEKEVGLDSGADDYLTKPFAMKELQARIRGPQGYSGNKLTAGDLELDTVLHRLTRNGEEIKLLPKELSLLEFFFRHKGQVFTAEAVLNGVWSSESGASPGSFRTCLKRLRQKIDREGDASLIEYVHGLGYRVN